MALEIVIEVGYCGMIWHPISFQVQFKVLIITFEALNGIGPGFLQDLISCEVSVVSTRSDKVDRLQVPSLKCTHLT